MEKKKSIYRLNDPERQKRLDELTNDPADPCSLAREIKTAEDIISQLQKQPQTPETIKQLKQFSTQLEKMKRQESRREKRKKTT